MHFCQKKNIVLIIYGHKDAKKNTKTLKIQLLLIWPKNLNSTPKTTLCGSDKSKQVIQLLGDEDLVKDMDDGRKVINLDEKNIVTIIKSDGTSLYITRDIAAALDRREKFGFEKLIYDVDNAQGHHF